MLGASQGLLQATDDVDDEKGGREKEDDGGDCDDEIVK